VILPREQIRRVIAGNKTEARVPTTYAELKPDRVVPIQPSARDEVACRVRIVECAAEQLGDITPRGAWKEGFRRKDDFFAWFEARFGSADRDMVVYVRRFVLLNYDPPRFLARQNGMLEPDQYASSAAGALPQEPEAVTRAEQETISREAHHRDVRRASDIAVARRERWSLSERLARIETMSVHVDVSRELRVIEKRIAAMEKGIGEAA
jgi:hypothetical protein